MGDTDIFAQKAVKPIAIVNYEVFCRAGYGTTEASVMLSKIALEFSVLMGKNAVSCSNGVSCRIYRASSKKPGIDSQDPAWYREVISFTMDIYLTKTMVDAG